MYKISEKFKIIFVTHYVELYGANRSLLDLIDGLCASGINDMVVIVPFYGKIIEALKQRSIPFHIIPFKTEIQYPAEKNNLFKSAAKFLYNWGLVLRHKKSLKSNKKTIIHTNSSATFIGAYFSYWLRLPHVWHLREFGWEDYKFKYNFGKRYFNYWLSKASAAVAISNAIYETRLKNCSVPIKKVIYNGVIFLNEVNKKKLHFEIRESIETDKKYAFGIIGLINEEKGQFEAIKAFNLLHKKHRNTILFIAGKGKENYLQFLSKKSSEYGLQESLQFSGYVEKPFEFYKQINCLLMCSKNEGLGRVTIEAMSLGIPVIGYNAGGTQEIIVHNYNGLLYKNGAEELSFMMEKLTNDKILVNKLSKNAFKTVEDVFTIDKYATEINNIYSQIIKNK
ncbi:glycosyltransferase family 4 protein [Parafilimonas sp.]|uniref:glycosyltransferase family 4 protein n=1 Tax=Parafilimonas sp. TaxID=1969739 RepID=UPI003F80D24B